MTKEVFQYLDEQCKGYFYICGDRFDEDRRRTLYSYVNGVVDKQREWQEHRLDYYKGMVSIGFSTPVDDENIRKITENIKEFDNIPERRQVVNVSGKELTIMYRFIIVEIGERRFRFKHIVYPSLRVSDLPIEWVSDIAETSTGNTWQFTDRVLQ